MVIDILDLLDDVAVVALCLEVHCEAYDDSCHKTDDEEGHKDFPILGIHLLNHFPAYPSSPRRCHGDAYP